MEEMTDSGVFGVDRRLGVFNNFGVMIFRLLNRDGDKRLSSMGVNAGLTLPEDGAFCTTMTGVEMCVEVALEPWI